MISLFIQARMGSSRFPGKVLKTFNGIPSLICIINRVQSARTVDRIAVLTTHREEDDAIVSLCIAHGIECFRGNETDVLDRYYQAARYYCLEDTDSVIRITADCPLVDPNIIDVVTKRHLETGADYTSNTVPPTFPDGLDVEIFTVKALQRVWSESVMQTDREHVTAYFRKHSTQFELEYIQNSKNLSHLRLTVDEPEDYHAISTIYQHFGDADFYLDDIVRFLDENPGVVRVNQKYSRNYKYYDALKTELSQEESNILDGSVILITGGTGSFGNRFVNHVFEHFNPRKVIIYSRDEFKQFEMKNRLKDIDPTKLRFFIGDVRDRERLFMAARDVDYIIHAAALKQVPVCEYNPFEAVKTNIIGAQNIIEVAIERGVKKVVALSTDKAVNPINLYGGTKLVSDKLFVSSNAYAGKTGTVFSVVRYGNVAGSRGSVIPFFRKVIEEERSVVPITDYRMTRFWITLDQGVDLVLRALYESRGGETYISKIPSFRITDLARAMGGESVEMEEVGMREGEKLHEVMITREDSRVTYDYGDHYIIYPNFEWWDYKKHFKDGGAPIQEGFEYSSDTNESWLSVEELQARVEQI